VSSLDLSLREVKELVSFSDGAIQAPDIRRHLWKSWGLCQRHAWGYAIVESELRWQPLGTTVLYVDLTQRAAAIARRSAVSSRARARRFEARSTCPTCDYLLLVDDGDERFAVRQAKVNGRARSRVWIAGSRAEWLAHSCPACLGGDGLPCRPHLLAGRLPCPPDLADRLDEIIKRLLRFQESMTWGADPATANESASLVEVLGWFAGWETPDRIVLESL
jgi:hypothetical protein